jgi:AcrR family transcriptional regulator
MTRDDIIRAAFKVWGRELYRTTSLTDIAQELGVSKTALYRHFKDKDSILEAMYPAYFDDCAAFIKNGCDKAASVNSRWEAHLIIMRTIAEYFIRNSEAFIFSLARVFDNRDKRTVSEEFRKRGIDFGQMVQKSGETASYPSKMQLILATLFFGIAYFHHQNYESGEKPTEEAIRNSLVQLEERIRKGLKLDAQKISALDYENLEKQAAGTVYEDTEDNALLRAVAGAVAEAGPWNASMEMVARRSGLSKSGLYAHFKSKQDMLDRLFVTEFNRIANFARAQIETHEAVEAQLYHAIISIVYYLRSRPELLVAIDWIKTRQLELGKGVSDEIFRIVGDLKLEAIRGLDLYTLGEIAHWILFMIVNTLAWRPPKEIPNESFRFLFQFISLGLEGLNL